MTPSNVSKERYAVRLVEDDGYSRYVICMDGNPELAVEEAFDDLSRRDARKIVSVFISDLATWQRMEVPEV